MANFGPVTLEIEVWKYVLLRRYGKNRPILPNISTTTESILANVSALVEASTSSSSVY